MLPNFIIVGAPKAGTTSLYSYLAVHPQIFMSNPKELNYFSWEELEEQRLYYKDFKVKTRSKYESLFDGAANAVAVGEASVSYLFYPKVPAKIKAAIPSAKIVIILRNPIDRGYSHYLMDQRLGLVNLSYKSIVSKSSPHQNINLYFQQYVELGLYYEQVKRYLEVFGRERVKICLTEDLQRNPQSIIEGLYAFLGVDKLFAIDAEKAQNSYWISKSKMGQCLYSLGTIRNLASVLFPAAVKNKIKSWLFANAEKPRLDKDIASFLLKTVYEQDIKKLETLILRDLSEWYKSNE